MSWVPSALLTFLGLATLIVLHEAGHFAAAKAVGMRVEKFMLFFGKPLVGFRRGETFYGIGPIPLGGYVKITGMNPTEEIPPEHAHRAYWRQPVWKRLVVIGAGPLVNLVLAFAILWVLFIVRGQFEQTNTVREIERGSPAAEVLRDGDRLVAVDGKRGDQRTLSDQIASHRCEGTPVAGCQATTPAVLTIERDGRLRELTVTPRYDPRNRKTRIGFRYGGELVGQGPLKAAGTSADTMWQVTEATVGVIVRLFYDAKARDEVGGIVGSYEATRQSFEFDTGQAIFILGLISLSLAVVNLFPFLPLDGGHMFWALAEKVRGRAIPFRVMERASLVGFALVAVLFFIGLQNDVQRISSGELSESVR